MGTDLKFDRRTCKILAVLMITALAFFAFGLICVLFFDDISSPMILIGTAVLGLMIGGPLSLLFTYLYIKAKVYLGRLSRNGFTVPDSKAECGGKLENLPRAGEPVTNNYKNDSRTALALCIICFLANVCGDIWYIYKWTRYGIDSTTVMFVMLLIFHLAVFFIPVLVFRAQSNPDRYIDNVDIKDGRKVRMSIMSAILVLAILSGAGAFGIVQADSMTSYIYKSKYGRYEKTHEQFLSGATMDVTSDSLTYGVWNEDIAERAPQLSFEPVDGAAYYVIYMVDESSNNRLLWYASHVDDTDAPEGAGEYSAPEFPEEEGEHNLTVYVYALQGEPRFSIDLELDDDSLSGDLLYYDILNVIDNDASPYMYGNVIAYGYVTGTYSMNHR